MEAGKTLMASIVWRGLYYVSAFVINILIARHFQASASGTVYYMSSIYALLVLFISFSMESGIIYFVAGKRINTAGLFNFSVFWSLATGLIVLGCLVGFTGNTQGSSPRSLFIFSALSFIVGNMLTAYCSAFFYARNSYMLPNLVNVLSITLLIIVLPYGGHSLLPWINDSNYFYVYFGSFMLQGICLAVAVRIKYIKNDFLRLPSRVELRLLFKYCWLAFVANIVYFLLYRIDYFFVEKYCTQGQLGNYVQVSKIGHLFFLLPTILASAVFPITAGGKKENIAPLLTQVSRIIFFLYLIACILLAVTGRWLFLFVFGESFSEMYPAFLLLIPGILALSGLFTLTAYFAGKNQVRTNIIGCLYALCIVVVGDLVFIPTYGIEAAALVSSIGYIVYQAYILFMFKKEFPISVNHFFVINKADFTQVKQSIAAFINQREKRHL
jgi:O-antigen/teichoic acid export membrane protein